MENENAFLEKANTKSNHINEEQLQYMAFIIQHFDEAVAVLEYENNEIHYCFNNAAHQKLTGISADEISGKHLIDTLGEPFYKTYETKIEESILHNKRISFKGRALWRNEEKELICRLIPFQENKKKYVIAIETESLFLKSWMKENQLSVTKFDLMFQANASSMLLIEPDTGNIVDANPAALHFYQYSLEELTSMKIQQINTLTDEEIREQRQRAVRESKQYFLFRHRLKNGEIRLVDVYSSPIEINDQLFLFSIILDATKREESEQELFREKELQRITMDSIGDAVVTTDMEGHVTYLNKSAVQSTGWTLEEICNELFRNVFYMVNEHTFQEIPCIVDKVLQTSQKQELGDYILLRTKSGNFIPIEDSADPIIDKNGNIYGVVVIFRDITHAKEKKKKIEFLSYHDGLTNLYNRRFYYDNYEGFENASIYPLGFIMGDVNGLKMANDVFGHKTGDNLLITVSDTLSEIAEPEQIVIRWGGDEFVIVVPNATNEKLENIIEHAKKNLQAKYINGNLEVSVSFGSAIKENPYDSTDSVLKEAEEKMYHIKLFESKSLRGNTIHALMTTLDEKSQETKEHTVRLSKICIQIAEAMHLPSEGINRLELLAMLHDIGKIGIPDQILGKKGALSDSEWDIMKTHPQIGYRIASNVTELSFVANEILHHHERWDGTGYPSRLSGEQIPVNCRILSVVDTYDAMTNDRIYRKACSKEDALSEIMTCSGSQFDPQIVDIFLNQVADTI